MLVFAFLSHRWQHLPWRLRDLLAEYVGQHTLIMTILSGVTDTHISIYINKWNRVWIQMMYHKVWMMSDRNCTTDAGEFELVGWQATQGAGIVTQRKLDNRTQQSPCLLRVNLTTLIACVWGCSPSRVFARLMSVKKRGFLPSVDLTCLYSQGRSWSMNRVLL